MNVEWKAGTYRISKPITENIEEDEDDLIEDTNFMTYAEMSPTERRWHKYLEDNGYYDVSIDFYPRHLRGPLIKYSFEWDTFSDYVNGQLRRGVVGNDVKIIDEAFRQPMARLLRDETLYRIVRDDFGFDGKVGDEFTDPAYVSTSICPDNFYSGVRKQGTLCFEIRARRGSSAILISTRNVNESEFEFLLPRDSRFRITGVEDNVVFMEVI